MSPEPLLGWDQGKALESWDRGKTPTRGLPSSYPTSPIELCLFLFVVIIIIGHFMNYFHSHKDLMR